MHLFEDHGLLQAGRRRQTHVVALAGDHRQAQIELLGEQARYPRPR